MLQFIFLVLSLSLTAIAAPEKPKLITAELMASATPEDWRSLDPANTLYVELPSGRVIIELYPDFAPQHVANIKALAQERYWDGLAIVRVQDNYVVQWADPKADKPDKKKIQSAQPHLPAEFDRAFDSQIPFSPLPDKDIYASEVGFSHGFPIARDKKLKKMWLLHCYGAVGAGRDTSIDSGGGAELYAVIGHAPRHLDRNVTLVGRVVWGMEHFSSLPRGTGHLGFFEKPEKNIPIRSISLASAIAEKDRTAIEVLRTDTPLFKKLIEARRNRKEEWFHSSASRLEICNMSATTRIKTISK